MILMDTHIWVKWILLGEKGLPPGLFERIENASALAVSSISCFEVALLAKQKRLELPLPASDWLEEALSPSGVVALPISCEISRHAVELSDIHKDPADRIIIATAVVHQIHLLSLDSEFPKYPELADLLIPSQK